MDDFGFLELVWSLLIVYFILFALLVLFYIVVDVFRSKDLSGVGKGAWLVFLLVLPFIGALVYVIARGHGMMERGLERKREEREELDAYVRDVAGSGGGPSQEIARAKDLLDSGAITADEFEALKAKALA
jgi:hypothetical protein